MIGACIEVHRHLGPGLLESIYEECVCTELCALGIAFERQVRVPVMYKGIAVPCDYRVDLIVDRKLIVEIKSVVALLPVHEAQLLTYLRVTQLKAGLLINFNEATLRRGLRRMIQD
ncbi:MAG: GxxExxY protein [Polyangiales bacterium]